MSEAAPATSADPSASTAAASASVPAEKAPTKKAKRGGRRKAVGPLLSELITNAVAASEEHNSVSLAALKKILAASGYDVEKNNSRIKLGLKSLVSKGTLVQTKGTGASGSFRLNKRVSPGEIKNKAKKSTPVKAKKPVKKTKKNPGSVTVKSVKTPKKAKKTAAVGAKKTIKSPKTSKAAKPKKMVKSPAETKAAKTKGQVVKSKAVKPKKVLPKK